MNGTPCSGQAHTQDFSCFRGEELLSKRPKAVLGERMEGAAPPPPKEGGAGDVPREIIFNQQRKFKNANLWL